MGVRWLGRQCSVVLYEFATPADENPDVIGWAPGAGSVLIECKLSRSDFLGDATKTVRRNPRAGMGQRRFYLCPAELIQVKDLHFTPLDSPYLDSMAVQFAFSNSDPRASH